MVIILISYNKFNTDTCSYHNNTNKLLSWQPQKLVKVSQNCLYIFNGRHVKIAGTVSFVYNLLEGNWSSWSLVQVNIYLAVVKSHFWCYP